MQRTSVSDFGYDSYGRIKLCLQFLDQWEWNSETDLEYKEEIYQRKTECWVVKVYGNFL